MSRFNLANISRLSAFFVLVITLACFLKPYALIAQESPEEVIQRVLQPEEGTDRTLFVLQFSSTGMTESAARAFSNMVARNLDNTNRFEIIPLDIVEDEIQKQAPNLLPCFEIGCGIQMGKIMALDWILSGHIALTTDGIFSLNIKLVHIFDNSLAFDDTIRFSDENMDRRLYELSNRVANNAPLSGKVISANNKIAVTDLGEQNGISVGDRLIIYRNKAVGDVENAQTVIMRRHNIGILTITRVGKKISEGTYFQTIETPSAGQSVTTYLDKRKQIRLIDDIRKELDTQERNVYEIKKSVDLSPIQLEDIAKKKWLITRQNLEYEKELWEMITLGTGAASLFFLSQLQSGDNILLLGSMGGFAYSAYKYFTNRAELDQHNVEGKYRGYLELKVRPEFGEIGLKYKTRF